MGRKQISDDNAILIAKSLHTNKGLEHVELNGNNLEAAATESFGKMLMKNRTLKVLNMEMNNLTNSGKDYKGIRQLAEAIKRNRVLISLNLNSTDLD